MLGWGGSEATWVAYNASMATLPLWFVFEAFNNLKMPLDLNTDMIKTLLSVKNSHALDSHSKDETKKNTE